MEIDLQTKKTHLTFTDIFWKNASVSIMSPCNLTTYWVTSKYKLYWWIINDSNYAYVHWIRCGNETNKCT